MQVKNSENKQAMVAGYVARTGQTRNDYRIIVKKIFKTEKELEITLKWIFGR
jgi:hypothetical protein